MALRYPLHYKVQEGMVLLQHRHASSMASSIVHRYPYLVYAMFIFVCKQTEISAHFFFNHSIRIIISFHDLSGIIQGRNIKTCTCNIIFDLSICYMYHHLIMLNLIFLKEVPKIFVDGWVNFRLATCVRRKTMIKAMS